MARQGALFHRWEHFTGYWIEPPAEGPSRIVLLRCPREWRWQRLAFLTLTFPCAWAAGIEGWVFSDALGRFGWRSDTVLAAFLAGLYGSLGILSIAVLAGMAWIDRVERNRDSADGGPPRRLVLLLEPRVPLDEVRCLLDRHVPRSEPA